MKQLIKDFFEHNLNVFIIYLVIILLTFPIESIGLSTIYGKIFEYIGSSNKNDEQFKYLLIFLIILFIISKIGYYIKDYYYGIILPKFYRFTREYIFQKILERYKTDFEELRSGMILSNFHDIPSAFYNLLIEILTDYIPNILAIIIIIVYLYIIEPKLGLIILAGSVLMFLIIKTRFEQCIKFSEDEHNTFQDNNELINDKLGNLFSIYTSSNIESELKDNESRERILENKIQNNIYCSLATTKYTGAISILMFCLCFYVIYYSYKNQTMKTSTLITASIVISYYFTYLSYLIGGMSVVADNFGTLLVGDKFLKELRKNENKKDNNLDMDIEQGIIELQNVSFKYPSRTDNVLKDINMTIKGKRITALYGLSGSGKTTIMKLITKFYKVNSGSIYIDGENINDINIDSLREQISIVDQNVKLFDNTVIYNIKYGNNVDDDYIYKILKATKLDKLYTNLPNGIYTQVGVNGSLLSKGQRQTITIIRGLLKPNIKILILDEPTSSIDAETKIKILSLIRQFLGVKTVFIITHDNAVIPYVDKIYRLEDGKILN